MPGNDMVNREGNASWYDYIKGPDFLKRVSEIRVPSLFVFATQDVRPSWPAQQLAALIQGSEQKFIEGAAHYIWLTHAAQLKSVLRNFIEENF